MLSKKEILILGMMIFALFLGAGNVIFPPMEGYHSGTHWLSAALGFVFTGVLMPFITLVIVSIRGGGNALSNDLPKPVAIAFWVTLYLVIGPAFAMPRVTNVAYEMAWLPLELTASDSNMHLIFAIVFNLIGLIFILNKTSIIDNVGKYMTPTLLVLLIIIAVAVILSPLSTISAPSANYAQQSALAMGMIGGYQTMDVLAATAFGGIVAHAFKAKQIFDSKIIVKNTLLAGSISILLLSALYFSLFYLGATSSAVATDAENGGQIFARYVNALFGHYGVWVMSTVVMLANLTTFVGVVSACADYFASFSKRLTYPFWATLIVIMTIIISENGLTRLLVVTIPALLLIYPIAITMVFLQFFRHKLPSIKLSYYSTCAVAFFFSTVDSLKYANLLPQKLDQFLQVFPLYAESLAWLLPTLFVFILSIILGVGITKNNRLQSS